MNEEIKIITLGDIFKNIETEEKALSFKDYIKYLQQKVEQQDKEIERLNNIIDELEKWLEENKKISQAHENVLGVNISNLVLDKLKELKENNKDCILNKGDNNE